MRVWIISDKRWGDSDEEHWVAEVGYDPTPTTTPDESVWDRVRMCEHRYQTKRQALAAVRKLKSSVTSSARVYHRGLECVEGNGFDWAVGEVCEVECTYDPSAVLRNVPVDKLVEAMRRKG